jgi:hypothetical protein
MKKYNVRPAIERLREKYIVDKFTGCWLWQGYHQPNGYGKFSYNGQPRYAHRVSYELHVGPIPNNLVIDHLCGNTRCVNPDHLEAVTQQTNIIRYHGECEHGNGKTKCKEGCSKEYYRNKHQENREANLANMKQYYQDNLEKERERKRNYYHKNRGS